MSDFMYIGLIFSWLCSAISVIDLFSHDDEIKSSKSAKFRMRACECQ